MQFPPLSRFPSSGRAERYMVIWRVTSIMKEDALGAKERCTHLSGASVRSQCWNWDHLETVLYQTLSHVWLCDCSPPWTVACQAPLSMGFSRQEYWSGLPCPSLGDLPNPGLGRAVHLDLLHCRQIFYHWATREDCGEVSKPLCAWEAARGLGCAWCIAGAAPSSLEYHNKDGLLVHTPCHPPTQLTNFRKPWPPLIRPPVLKTREALAVLEYEKRISVWSPVGSQIEVSKDGPVCKSYKGRYGIYPTGLLTMPPIPIRLHLQSAAGVSSWSLAISDASTKRENAWVWLAKGITNREEAPLLPVSPSTPLSGTARANPNGFHHPEAWPGNCTLSLPWQHLDFPTVICIQVETFSRAIISPRHFVD